MLEVKIAAIAVVIVLGIVVLALLATTLRMLTNMQRQYARERDLLINQVCHLSGRTWSPPPASSWEPPVEDEFASLVLQTEQEPDL